MSYQRIIFRLGCESAVYLNELYRRGTSAARP